MKTAIERLKQAKKAIQKIGAYNSSFRTRDSKISALTLISEAIEELNAPLRWETPEQWEKRKGEEWPDNAAVYWKWADDDAWTIGKYSVMRDEYDPFGVWIICATVAGPRPYGWKPEEEI
jgi:hypothetical protein